MTLFEWIAIGLLALIVIELEMARSQLAQRGRQISELVKTSERSVGLVYGIYEHAALLAGEVRRRDRRTELGSDREAEEYRLAELESDREAEEYRLAELEMKRKAEEYRLERKAQEEANIRDPKATSGRGAGIEAVRRKRQLKKKKPQPKEKKR